MKRIPVSALVVILRRRAGAVEVLLLKRSRDRDGFWQPVTGSLLPGETPREAALREACEETGISHFELLYDLRFSYDFRIAANRLDEYDPRVTINHEHCFAMLVPADADVRLSDEHETHGWFGFEEAAAKLLYDENRAVLRRVRDAVDDGRM